MDLDKLFISGELVGKAIFCAISRVVTYSCQGLDNGIFIGLDGERLSAAELADRTPCGCNNVGQASDNVLG